MPSTRYSTSRGSSSYTRGSSSYASGSSAYGGSGASSYGGSSRAYSGSSTATSVYGGKNPGQPLYAFVAICVSALLYAVIWITWVAVGARVFKEQYATYFFMFILIANAAVVAMIILDFFYVRYRFNCTSLSVSFVYCGSAGLVIAGLIMLCLSGADIGSAQAGTGIFSSGNVAAIICWVFAIIAVGLQICGHYFYG